MRNLLPALLAAVLASPAAAGPTLSAHRVLKIETAPGATPAGFLPLRDGRVVLLDAARGRLRFFRGGAEEATATLRGGGFRPDRSFLVDLCEDDAGRILVLDARIGTVWIAEPTGEIAGRFGMLVAPTRIGRGEDGLVYVTDMGTRRVVGFRDTRPSRSVEIRPGVAPFATAEGELPELRFDADRAVDIRLYRPGIGGPKVDRLATLEAPEGSILMDARVVGIAGGLLTVEVLLSRPGAQAPSATRLVRIATTGPRRGSYRVGKLPALLNKCLDCGPDLRVGGDGETYLYMERTGRYGVFALAGGVR